jgi:hypothetical protein
MKPSTFDYSSFRRPYTELGISPYVVCSPVSTPLGCQLLGLEGLGSGLFFLTIWTYAARRALVDGG